MSILPKEIMDSFKKFGKINKQVFGSTDKCLLQFFTVYEVPWIIKWECLTKLYPQSNNVSKLSKQILVRWWPKFNFNFLLPKNFNLCLVKIAHPTMDNPEESNDISKLSSLIRDKQKGLFR